MAFGFGSLNPADDAAASPEMAAFIRARLAGLAPQPGPGDVPAAVAPGSSGYVAPFALTGPPTAVVREGAPSLSSVVNGVMSGATEAGQGLLHSAVSGFTLPRDVYQGKVDLGSDEAIGRTMDLAGLMAGGSAPAPAPKGALRIFGGWNAETADHAALAEAQNMAGTGADRKAIWDRTGWFQGPDQQWRFEIPDQASKIGTKAEDDWFSTGKMSRQGGQSAGVSSVLWHNDLYNAYPELRRLGADISNPADYRVDPTYAEGAFHGLNAGITGRAGSLPAARDLLLHELQHGVQASEGFARGGNPAAMMPPEGSNLLSSELRDWQMDQYRRQAGEVEARNVQARRDFTPEQRRAIPPWETQDVADADQIVRFGMGGPQMSVASAGAKNIDELRQVLEADHPDISQYVSQRASGGPVTVNKVVVPPEARGQGAGTQFMRDVLDYADANGHTVALTPSKDFGGKIGALRDWYSSLGFVLNKGRMRDQSINEDMLRAPLPFSFARKAAP